MFRKVQVGWGIPAKGGNPDHYFDPDLSMRSVKVHWSKDAIPVYVKKSDLKRRRAK